MRDGRTNKQTTSEDSATQLLICEALSLAIFIKIFAKIFHQKCKGEVAMTLFSS